MDGPMPQTLPERNLSRSSSLGTAMEKLKHRWGWFVGLGALAIVLGATALVLDVHATITTVYIIAVFMIVAGGSEITVGLGSRTWGRFFLWALAGFVLHRRGRLCAGATDPRGDRADPDARRGAADGRRGGASTSARTCIRTRRRW